MPELAQDNGRRSGGALVVSAYKRQLLENYLRALALDYRSCYALIMTDWRIITGDCIETMASMTPGTVRLMPPDPPYNQGVEYGPHCGDALSPEQYRDWSRAWLSVAAPLLTPDGSLWLLVSWEWVYDLKPIAESAGLHLRQTIVWSEGFGPNCTR
jgi:DNA modification methylase